MGNNGNPNHMALCHDSHVSGEQHPNFTVSEILRVQNVSAGMGETPKSRGTTSPVSPIEKTVPLWLGTRNANKAFEKKLKKWIHPEMPTGRLTQALWQTTENQAPRLVSGLLLVHGGMHILPNVALAVRRGKALSGYRVQQKGVPGIAMYE